MKDPRLIDPRISSSDIRAAFTEVFLGIDELVNDQVKKAKKGKGRVRVSPAEAHHVQKDR